MVKLEWQGTKNHTDMVQIAELVAEYKSLEAPATERPTTTRTPLLERNVNIATASRQERTVIQHNRANIDENPFTIRADDEDEDENEAQDKHEHEHEDDSTSLSSFTPSSTGPLTTPLKKPTKAALRAQKKAKKSAKSTSKALRNQSRSLALVATSDVARVAQILHGDESDIIHDGSAHPLATDRTIEDVINRNLGFVKNIQVHKQDLFRSVAMGRRENKERKTGRKDYGGEGVGIEEVVGAIMVRLGVSVSGWAGQTNGCASTPGRKRASSMVATPSPSSLGTSSKTALAVVAKLRAAIMTDLEKHENEVHARYVRAGGFWRYVGKTVFERMTRIAAELDVGSGERWEKKWARKEGTRSGSEGGDGDGDGAERNVGDEGEE